MEPAPDDLAAVVDARRCDQFPARTLFDQRIQVGHGPAVGYESMIRIPGTATDDGRADDLVEIIDVVGIAALVTGLISIIKRNERSILVLSATLIGLFALLFVLGEFLFPH